MLKLNVEKIKSTLGKALESDYDIELEKIDCDGEELRLSENMKVHIRAENTGSGIVVSGNMNTALKMECGRCLAETNYPISAEFKEVFVHKSKADQIDNSDDDINFFEGDFICLDKMLVRNIILNMPIRVVCNQECKGICPQCGIDLNVDECTCTADDIDPRMEALRELLK